MRVAIINSNNISIKTDSKKGTEIFSSIFISNLAKRIKEKKLDIDVTAFASGDSDLPVKIESINDIAISLDEDIPDSKHIIFELELIAKAFSEENKFDLFHINIGDGDIVLPFARFIKKPIIITLHNTKINAYVKKYFSLFKDLKHVYFISISDTQRKFFPKLQYLKTIHHGIDITHNFIYSEFGGEAIMWAGRGIPKKGMDTVIKIARRMKKKASLHTLVKKEHKIWLGHQIEELKNTPPDEEIMIYKDTPRLELVSHYQQSKLFLFPIGWEEPFGLVAIESMACGTPIVAYARGSMSELIVDGVTGFLVNPSPTDIRGNWKIKKTGSAGLREAVKKIYAMRESRYLKMRQACRAHVEKSFTVDKMVSEYITTYKKVLQK